MSTAERASGVDQVGEIAGTIWRFLHEEGPQSMTQLIKGVDEPRDLVMQGIGWLAREGKISLEDEGRRKIVSLC